MSRSANDGVPRDKHANLIERRNPKKGSQNNGGKGGEKKEKGFWGGREVVSEGRILLKNGFFGGRTKQAKRIKRIHVRGNGG